MSETIYVVCGSIGEYSNRDEWVVCAYRDEDMAARFVVEAERQVRAAMAALRAADLDPDDPCDEIPDGMWPPAIDREVPFRQFDDVGYWYATVPILTEAP